MINFKKLLFFMLVSSFACPMIVAQDLEVNVVPKGIIERMDILTEISITFNKPMVPIGDIKKEFIPDFVVINPPVKGKFYWAGDRTLIFHPEQRFPFSTLFEVRVKKGTKSITGEVLNRDFVVTFETPTPSVVQSVPHQGSTINRKGEVLLVFNQPVSLDEISSKIKYQINSSLYSLPEGFRIGSAEAIEKIRNVREVLLSRKPFSVDVKAEYDSGSNQKVRIIPVSPLPLNSLVKIFIPKGFKGLEGNLGSRRDYEIGFQTPKTLLYGGISCFECNPYSTISIIFSNPVFPKEAKKALKLLDITEGKEVESREGEDDYWEGYSSNYVYLSDFFKLKPGHSYRLDINRDLKDVYGLNLNYHVVENFSLRSYPYSIELINRWGVIESKGPKNLSLRVVNVDSVRREIKEIEDNEIGKFLSYLDTQKPIILTASSPELKLKTERDKFTVINIDLRKTLGKENAIIYTELEVKDIKPGTDYEHGSRFVNGILQITDIGISLKYSPQNILVYTTSLSGGEPIKGCEIKIFNRKGELLWRGESDENGLALAPGTEDLGIKDGWEADFVVLAKKGDDRAFVTEEWSEGIEGWQFNLSTDWELSKKRIMGYIFTDRGAYRPGEDVYVKGIFRVDELKELTIPSDKEIEFKIYDSRQKELLLKTLNLNSYGSTSFSFKIPEDSPTGYYRIEARVPKELGIEGEDRLFRHSILVSEFRKPDFRVDVSVKKKDYFPEENMEGLIKGTYLYGAPMKNCKVRWTLRKSPTSFSPPLKGELSSKYYVFEDWTAPEEEYYGSEVVASGEGVLSKDGEFLVTEKLSYSKSPMSYLFEGEVIDVTEQAISNRTSFLLHPSDYYVGIEYTSYFVEKGKNFKTNVVALDKDGNFVKGRAIKLELIKREWHSVQEKEEGAYYRYKSEPVDTTLKTFELKSSDRPTDVEIPLESAGYYLLRASSKDNRGHTIVSGFGFYCIGEGFTAWERYDHNRIDLVPEKKELKPGEIARILVKSPWETAKGIVTLERSGVLEYFPVILKGSSQVIEIPIKRDFIPTIYVSVLLIKGRTSEKLEEGVDVGKPTFRLGYAKLDILPEEVYLKLDIFTEKEEFKPREKVKINIQVKDFEGKGKKAEVTLYAVDYGVLSLTGYKLPDPVSYFYKERLLGVRNSELRNVLISREYLKGKLAEEAGGGGFEEALFQIRADFRITPFWKGEVITDENGFASESFELPDSLTTFVIMGVAQTHDSHFGSSKKDIRVSKPLMLFPSLPRFLILGDKFEGGIRVQNNTREKGELIIKVKSITPNLKLLKDEEKISLAPEGSHLFRFPMEAISHGVGKLQFFATLRFGLKEERDAVEIKIPVRIPKLRIDSATYGSTDKREIIKISIPDNIYSDAGGLRISLSSSALSELEKGAEFLLEYPYGCTEQLSSKLVPFIALHGFTGAFKFKNFDRREIEKIVDETLLKIYKNQREDGGFGFWSSSTESFPYISSYVLFVFKMAEDRGFKIDKDVKKSLINYLKNVLKGKVKSYYGTDLITRAFTLYALSLYGHHDESYQTLLYERRESLPLFAKAFLLSSIARTKKNSPMKDTLLREIINRARVEPSMVHFEEGRFNGDAFYMHSDLRTNSIILMALLDVNPESPFIEKLVSYILSKRKDGTWRNTQENSYALLSLSEYFRKKESKETDFTVSGRLDGKKLNPIRFLEIKKEVVNIAMEELLSIAKEITLSIEKSGKGKLYWSANLSYYPKGIDFPETNQGFSVQKFYEDLNTGEEKKEFKLGDLIRVRLKVNVPSERNYVAIVDPIPAGTEIEDSYLKTTNIESQRKLGKISWYFHHVEKYDDRMQIFADRLPAGEHEFVYIVRATSKGTFIVPSTKVEEMYNPEVFGTTKGEIVKIE